MSILEAIALLNHMTAIVMPRYNSSPTAMNSYQHAIECFKV